MKDLFTCLYTTVEGRQSGVYIYAMYPATEPDVAYKVPCNSSPPSNKVFFFLAKVGETYCCFLSADTTDGWHMPASLNKMGSQQNDSLIPRGMPTTPQCKIPQPSRI